MSKFLVWARAHAKMLAAAAGAAATAIAGFVAPDSTTGHVVTVVLAVLTTLGVYAVPNVPAPSATTINGGTK